MNEADAMIEISQRINRTILQFEGGVRSCPAFIGCYNEDQGTVCYSNAGHTPAFLRDGTGLTRLEATGLTLGIVLSHYPGCIHGPDASRGNSAYCLAWYRGGVVRRKRVWTAWASARP
jgi:hypothetical protein